MKRGDIIVFGYPVDIRQTFVKRVIGVPGDRIRIENKQVFRNGLKLNEPYKIHKTEYIDGYRDNFPSQPYLQLSEGAIEMLQKNVQSNEIVVPPAGYFAMGDNRDNSLDSRFWGFVPRENIIGKPLIIYWSYETTRSPGKSHHRHHHQRLTWSRTSLVRPAGAVPSCSFVATLLKPEKFRHGLPSLAFESSTAL
ncbi:MAG: signal peptidase I [Bryobacteraceae bacterium]